MSSSSSSSSRNNSRDTSPDPIVLPSSPLGSHRPARKSTPRRSGGKTTLINLRDTPSKSVVLAATPNGAGGESPWRIRVTVEAEAREESATAREESAMVRGESATATAANKRARRRERRRRRRSASPSKESAFVRTVPLKEESPGEEDRDRENSHVKVAERKTRKRKGTPIRRGRRTRHHQPRILVENDDNDDDDVNLEMPLPARPSASGSVSASGSAKRRRISGHIGPLHSQRLSLAREELDLALQDAVGYGEGYPTRLLGDVDFSKSTRMSGLGDATLSRNEDFSMISAETLQTAKDSSLVSGWGWGNSQGRNSQGRNSQERNDQGRNDLERNDQERNSQGRNDQERNSQGSASGFMASSPPKRGRRRSILGEPVEWGRKSVVGRSITQLKSGAPPLRRSTTSQPNEAATSYGMHGANEEDISHAFDADIWQDEASRSREEQREEDDDGKDDLRDDHDADEDDIQDDNQDELQAEEDNENGIQAEEEIGDGIQAEKDEFQPDDLQAEEDNEDGIQAEEDQLQSDAAARTASRSPPLEDLFANQPLRPARGKIPKTWRRSSGMDFSYVDSPGHGIVEDAGQSAEDDEEKRHSTDGSGVLTPPSTSDDDEEEEVEEGDGNDDHGGEEDDDQEDPQSEWNQPDAEATRYEGQIHSVKQNRPRRPPPRPMRDEGTVDLTDLWNLKSSPMKAPAPPGTKVVDSPLRKSLPPKSSHMHGSSLDQKGQPSHSHTRAPAPTLNNFKLPVPPQRRPAPPPDPQRSSSMPVLSPAVLDRSRTRFPNSQSRVEVELDSFASKASDQRQLLMEMTPRVGTGVQQDYVESSEIPSSSPIPPQVIRSYEEHLNVESPKKIPVHFGDGSSSLMPPPDRLFVRQSANANHFGPVQQQQQQQQSQRKALELKPIPFVDRRAQSSDAVGRVGGLFTRLSETLWKAVVRPTGPTAIYPEDQEKKHCQQQQQQQQHVQQDQHRARQHESHPSTISASWEEETTTTSSLTSIFNPTLRTAIRNRYGVLPSTFPWTMSHMRTLHRMLNSLVSGRPDSLIPNAGPLHASLMPLINTSQPIISDDEATGYLFTREHAYVVFSFLQVLVDKEVVRAMESGEVQVLGDGLSRRLRGGIGGEGKGGEEGVFRVRERWREEGEIGEGFVVAALGCAVRCNEVS